MDDRLRSFLILCHELNYRKTAELLYLSQPAITKQIQSLEREYGAKLFSYDGRRLTVTEAGRAVEKFAETQMYNEQELRAQLRRGAIAELRIGATRSIGDFLLLPYLRAYLEEPLHQIALTVDNTERLLTMLDATELDFAIIEGFFSKQKYDCRLLREEPFVGICAAGHPFAGRVIEPCEMREESLLIRERGSGTRKMLERALSVLGYDLHLFGRVITTSSFHVIKDLAAEGFGISFVDKAVAETDGRLATFSVSHMLASHEFNAVWLKGTSAGESAKQFLR